jgi:hypothetical protein
MSKPVKTVWYRNTETGVTWEVIVGSGVEKRLRVELTDDAEDPQRRYELVDAPKPDAPAETPAPAAPAEEKLSRTLLDGLARAAGVPDPEKLANKTAVIDAITALSAPAGAGTADSPAGTPAS